MKIKKYLALSLAAFMALTPMGVMADEVMEEESEEVIEVTVEVKEVEEDSEEAYLAYEGEVAEVNVSEDKEKYSILVKDDKDDPENGLLFHLNDDVIILNDKTMEFASKDSFEEGMKVTAYYGENTPMLMSLPGQLTPDLVVINESEEPVFVYVGKFNEDLVSVENVLELNISEDTVIVDEDGEKVEKEALVDNTLVVIYTASTKSIPAQTSPDKVILMDKEEVEDVEDEIDEEEIEEENVVVLDKMTINKEEVKLNKALYKKDGVTMFPIRQVAEKLGYEVKWNNEDWSVELTKGVQWTRFAIGEDNYNFAKMIVKLGQAPEVKDGSTYVPLNFLEEILQAEVEIDENGMVEVEE